MKKLKLVLDRILEVLLCTLLLAMVFVALWAVISRYLLNDPASFTTEFLRYGLLWVSLLSAAYCFGKKAHLAIVFVKNRLKGRLSLTVNVLTELTIIFFAVVVLIYGGAQGIMMGMAENSPTLHIPIGYVYTVLPVSGVFMIFYTFINLLDHFRDVKINVVEEASQSTM